MCSIRKNRLNNLNRQIVSTINGLKKVTTPYSVKLRTDIKITGKAFTHISNSHQEREKRYSYFSERIIACQYYFRNPDIYRAPFHISDIFLFGKTVDLIHLFDIPLTEEPLFSQWYMHKKRPTPDYEPNTLCKFTPEQYIWLECIKKFGLTPSLTCLYSTDKDLLELSNKTIINNFFIHSEKHLNLDWPYRLKSSFPYDCY